jgi:hypothetical protein
MLRPGITKQTTAVQQSVGPLFLFPQFTQEQQMTDPTKIDPKLTAGVERLRNGTSSIPSESKTLGLTYGRLQGALKRELGAAGYSAL